MEPTEPEQEQILLEKEAKVQTREAEGPAPLQAARHTLSFNVFFDELVTMEKRKTTRSIRPIKIGDRLSIYWEKDKDIWHKPCHWLYDARVINTMEWQLPPSKDHPQWIGQYSLLENDVYGPEFPSGWGWTRDQTWDYLSSLYGPGASLITITWEPMGLLPSLREQTLLKRLHQCQSLKRLTNQTGHKNVQNQRSQSFFADSAIARRRK